ELVHEDRRDGEVDERGERDGAEVGTSVADESGFGHIGRIGVGPGAHAQPEMEFVFGFTMDDDVIMGDGEEAISDRVLARSSSGYGYYVYEPAHEEVQVQQGEEWQMVQQMDGTESHVSDESGTGTGTGTTSSGASSPSLGPSTDFQQARRSPMFGEMGTSPPPQTISLADIYREERDEYAPVEAEHGCETIGPCALGDIFPNAMHDPAAFISLTPGFLGLSMPALAPTTTTAESSSSSSLSTSPSFMLPPGPGRRQTWSDSDDDDDVPAATAFMEDDDDLPVLNQGTQRLREEDDDDDDLTLDEDDAVALLHPIYISSPPLAHAADTDADQARSRSMEALNLDIPAPRGSTSSAMTRRKSTTAAATKPPRAKPASKRKRSSSVSHTDASAPSRKVTIRLRLPPAPPGMSRDPSQCSDVTLTNPSPPVRAGKDAGENVPMLILPPAVPLPCPVSQDLTVLTPAQLAQARQKAELMVLKAVGSVPSHCAAQGVVGVGVGVGTAGVPVKEEKVDEEALDLLQGKPRYRLGSMKVKDEASGEVRYVCPGCRKEYKNANGLKYHLSHVHPNGDGMPLGFLFGRRKRELEHAFKPFPCVVEDCGKRYKNLNGLKYHIMHAHSEMMPKQPVSSGASAAAAVKAAADSAAEFREGTAFGLGSGAVAMEV
ncbi:Juxtaposed with another zinc finger protein 1, partial [Irineochytrium annulatum]